MLRKGVLVGPSGCGKATLLRMKGMAKAEVDECVAKAPGTPITHGVGPEHLQLADAVLAARVAEVEPAGSQTHLVLHRDGRDLVAVLRDQRAIRPGETVRLAPKAGLHQRFEPASGQCVGQGKGSIGVRGGALRKEGMPC
jgi:ABC-type sugar transport system ATPase subunit